MSRMKSVTPTTNPTPISRRRGRFVERDRKAEELLLELSRTKNCAERERLTDEIVRLHLDLCDGVAARYSGRSIPTEDLVQVARLALLVAIRRYKPGPGTSFIGYALPTISGELKRHFRDHGWMVRPPRRLQDLQPRVATASAELARDTGSEPTPAQIPRPHCQGGVEAAARLPLEIWPNVPSRRNRCRSARISPALW